MRQHYPQKPPLGTPINWAHPLTKGLVGFWLFNESGGDLANDLSGNGNHGTLNGMAFPPTATSGWNAGRRGHALSFDGTDDYVLIPDSSSLDGFTTFTISAWIYPIDEGDMYRTIVTKWSNYFFQFTNSETITTYIYGLSNPGWHATTTLIEYNKWQHFCLVYDGAHIRFYIDAIQDSNVIAATGTVTVTANDLSIGGVSDLSRMTKGTIDQVRIYNRALSAEEIKQLYLYPYVGFQQPCNAWLYAAAAGGLSIPVAMHQYRRLRT